MKKPFETNGYSDVGVTDPASPNLGPNMGGELSGLKYVDVEAAPPPDEENEKPRGTKRRKLVRGFLVLATLALVIIGFFLWTTSGKKKIDLAVRDQTAQVDRPTPQQGDDVTAQAIAEVRAEKTSPEPAAETTTAKDNAPVTIPLGGTVTAVESPPVTSVGGVTSTGATTRPQEIVSKRNPERSIRCAVVPKPAASQSKQPLLGTDSERGQRGVKTSLPPAAEKTVTLPPFGAMLPVRTLGAIYTLRPSLSRLELTRDLQGQGWMMKKGTVLVGQQRGSEFDRAYVSLMGFIDPNSGKLVKLSGDVLGADGAPGLKGKRRQISSRWARVLSRATSVAVSLGQAALSRGGGVVVNLPSAVSPELQGLSPGAIDRREFVEAPAGSTAFVLVTDLPTETRGVDPQPANEVAGGSSIRDDELANLLTGGSPEEIREALPRMSSQLRQIAEAVLRESGNSDVAQGSSDRKR